MGLLVFIATVTGGKKRKDFAQTTNACLSFLQEALLKHQWRRAAEYMHSYLQTLEDSDTYRKQAAPEVHNTVHARQPLLLLPQLPTH